MATEYALNKTGAIDKKTRKYVLIPEASKSENYECPDCGGDALFKISKTNKPYFKHKALSSQCGYFQSPTETQTRLGAKLKLKDLLDCKTEIRVVRFCKECEEDEDVFNTSDIDYTNLTTEVDFSFTNNGTTYSADVALLVSGDHTAPATLTNQTETAPKTNEVMSVGGPTPVILFEVKRKNSTEADRPDTNLCEFDATQFLAENLTGSNKNEEGGVDIICKRDILCDVCEAERVERINQLEIERLAKEASREEEEMLIRQYENSLEPISTNKFIPFTILISNNILYEIGHRRSCGTEEINIRILSNEKCQVGRHDEGPHNSHIRSPKPKPLNTKETRSIEKCRKNGWNLRLDKKKYPFKKCKIELDKRIIRGKPQFTEYITIDETRISSSDYSNDTSGPLYDYYELFAEADAIDGDVMDMEELLDSLGRGGMNPPVTQYTIIRAEHWLDGGGRDEYKEWYECQNKELPTKDYVFNGYFLHDRYGALKANLFNAPEYCNIHNIEL